MYVFMVKGRKLDIFSRSLTHLWCETMMKMMKRHIICIYSFYDAKKKKKSIKLSKNVMLTQEKKK